LEGVFKQGEVISILALSQDFGISRTPITIACQQLEYEGFLDIAHKQGVIVRPISISEIREIYEVRAEIEPYCAKRAFFRINGDDIKFLEKSYQRQEQAVSGQDALAFMREDLIFHKYIIEKAGNSLLTAFFNGIYDRLYMIGVVNDSRLQEILNEHRGIIDCLIKQDSQGYIERTERHVQSNITESCLYSAKSGSPDYI